MTKTIAHISDLHISDRDKHNGLGEQVSSLVQAGKSMERHRVAAILVAGDIFDHASTPDERNAAIQIFAAWAKIAVVVIIRGNHDKPGDLSYLQHIKTENEIIVREFAEVINVAGLTIACLPWPDRAALSRAVGADSQLEMAEAVKSALNAVMLGFKAKFDVAQNPKIILAHAELVGSEMDGGQPVAASSDFPLNVGDLLETGVDYVALGHIHKSQTLGSGRIHYSGGSRQGNFGEHGDKGWSLVELSPGRTPIITQQRAEYRELHTVKASLRADDTAELETEDQMSITADAVALRYAQQGSSIRLTYEVTEEQRRIARVQAESAKKIWLQQGAHTVHIDEKVLVSHRLRSDEITQAQSVDDKLRAWWAATETPVNADELLEKTHQIESEIQK